jgi:small subunit ribosomal protein S3
MGQKINPQSLRLGIVKPWPVRWFFAMPGSTSEGGKKSYRKLLEEDEAIRKVIREKIAAAGIAGVDIERTYNSTRLTIRAARPGFIIGRGGKGIEEFTKALEAALAKLRGKKPHSLSVNIEELKRSEVSAAHVAQQIAWDLEKRLPFRRVMNKHLDQMAQNKDVKGAKILVGGRLNGAEISRREWKATGSIPLQTLRANIDYGRATAFCSYGTLGVKVWIYKGEVVEKQ